MLDFPQHLRMTHISNFSINFPPKSGFATKRLSLWKEWKSFTIQDVWRVFPRNFVHCFQTQFHIRLGYETLSFLFLEQCFLKKSMQIGNYLCRRWQFWQISPCQRTLQGDKSWHRIPAAWLRGPRDRQGQEKVWRVHWVAACSWQGTWSLATPAPPLSLPYHLHGGQGLSPCGDPPMGCGKWHM